MLVKSTSFLRIVESNGWIMNSIKLSNATGLDLKCIHEKL